MRSVKSYTAYIIILALAFIADAVHGQQRPIFTQYMFNGLAINPAYTGSHESMTLTASVRNQWSGIQGAPQTQVFSAHSPIKFSRSAGGMILMHDKAGVIEQSSLYGTYAYHIPVSKNGKISVGGQVGATYYNANFSDLNIATQNNVADLAFASNDRRLLPNVGIGAYYYSRRAYVGIAIPTLVNNKWNNYDQLKTSKQRRHYFLAAGYVFDLSPYLKLKPNVLLRWVESGPFQYDLNANLFIKDIVWVGVSYRMGDSVDGLLQWNITDQFAIGYSYGYPTTALASAQWGTHEIVINYSLRRDKHMIRSPRYF